MLSALLILVLAAQDEAAVKAALEKFAKDYKSKEVPARAGAVTELARTSHEKVHARLAQLLGQDAREVRIAAAEGLGTATNNQKKAAGFLSAAIAPNGQDLKVSAACAEALEKLEPGLGIKTLKSLFMNQNVGAAKAGIETAGEMRRRELVEPLINLLKFYETAMGRTASGGKAVTGGGIPGVGGMPADPEAASRGRALLPSIQRSLEIITTLKLRTAKEWEEWWKRDGGRPRANP